MQKGHQLFRFLLASMEYLSGIWTPLKYTRTWLTSIIVSLLLKHYNSFWNKCLIRYQYILVIQVYMYLYTFDVRYFMCTCFAFCRTIQWTHYSFIVWLFHIRYDVTFFSYLCTYISECQKFLICDTSTHACIHSFQFMEHVFSWRYVVLSNLKFH